MGKIAAELPDLGAEPPHKQDALRVRNLHPVFQIVPIGFRSRRVSADRQARGGGAIGGHVRGSYQLLVAQRVDWVEARRPARRHESEHDADSAENGNARITAGVSTNGKPSARAPARSGAQRRRR